MPSLVRMPTGLDRRDRPVDELAVVALQGGVVVAGDQHALAARGEVGRQLAAQPRVFDLPVQVRLAQPRDQRRQRRVPHQRGRAGLVAPEQRLARKLLHRRDFGEHRLHSGRASRRPSRGSTQPGVRWNTLTNSACLTSSGMIWIGAGAGADDRDPLAGEVVVVVPPGTVDLVPVVGVDAADVGEARSRAAARTPAPRCGRESACGRRWSRVHDAGVLVERQPGDLADRTGCGGAGRTGRPCPRCGRGSRRPASRSATRSGS